MPLFQIQDSDRPAFVVATDFNAALAKWQQAIMAEDDSDGETPEPPQGITLICQDDELIIGDGWGVK